MEKSVHDPSSRMFVHATSRGLGGVCVRRVRRAFASFFDAHEIRAKREASPNVEVDFALIHNKLNSLKRSKFVLYCYDNNSTSYHNNTSLLTIQQVSIVLLS